MSKPKIDLNTDGMEILAEYAGQDVPGVEASGHARRIVAYFDQQLDDIENQVEGERRDMRADEQRAHAQLIDARNEAAEHQRAIKTKQERHENFRNAQLGSANQRDREPRRDDVQRWARAAATKLQTVTRDHGVRAALTAGGIDVPSIVEPVVQKPAGPPQRVLELLVNRRGVDGNEFAYLVESARAPQPGVVADGELKPTSTYTFSEKEDRLRVFAHLSEAIPLRFIEDHDELVRIIQTQMGEDLLRYVETEVLNGSGTGEHLRGVLNTSGIQVQAFDTDVFKTARAAVTTAQLSGETPNAWVMNFKDMAWLDLLREDGTTGQFMNDVARAFGNLPVVGTTLLPEGTAVLADWNQVRLYVRNGVRIDADTTGELFEHNQIKLRVEGRFGSAVLRPAAVIKVALKA